MFNPENYNKHNKLQARDSLQHLEEYDKNVQWRDHCKSVIDIGSGDGRVTNELSKFIPCNFDKIVGCDRNEDMVRFATEHYGSDQASFRVVDIGEALPADLYGCFDQAFSFYTLQLVRDQLKAFSNIYDLLVPGGGCFFVILGYMPSYIETYRFLSKSERWGQWINDVDKIVSVYHDCDNPVEKIENIMTRVGFTDIGVKLEKKIYAYKDFEDCKLAIRAINIFPIPEQDYDDFLKEFIKVTQDMGNMDKNFQIAYQIITVHAKKNKVCTKYIDVSKLEK